MCRTRIIQCHQQFCPRLMHRQKAQVFPSWMTLISNISAFQGVYPVQLNPPTSQQLCLLCRTSQCCWKSKIPGRPTDHPWLMVAWSVSVLGGPSWYTETIKSIKELAKTSQSVFTLYSDTSTHRHADHADGFVQDCSISGALAMEILQSCAKPLISMHLRSCLSTFLPKYFLQNINNSLVAKRTIHGRTLGRPLDSWVAFGDQATVFQQQWHHGA